jgi:ribosome maturation factor RimP
MQGVLTAADDRTATLLLDDGTERTVSLDDVDKARTVFEWGPKPKPGKQRSGARSEEAGRTRLRRADSDEQHREQPSGTKSPTNTSNKEKRAS